MPPSPFDLAGLGAGAEELLATVLQTAAQPLWIVDRDGVIRFATPAAIKALGADELAGDDAASHCRRKDGTPWPAHECPLLRPLATGATVTSELDWFVRRDGSRFPVSYVSAPLGRGAVVTFTQLGDRRRIARHDRLADEIGPLIGGDRAHIWRYDDESTATLIASWSRGGEQTAPGTVARIEGHNVCSLVLRTGRPARIGSSAGAPIVVDGRPWGVAIVSSNGDPPLAADAEERIAAFTELVVTAVADTETHRERARLADEQAALRRVATLVARGVPAPELFGAVTTEVGRLLRADAAAMIRYGRDMMTAVGSWTAEGVEADTEVGRQWPLAGESLAPQIAKTGKPARIDDWRDVAGAVGDYVRTELGLTSSVGSPIVAGGRVWGNLVVHSTSGRLPGDTEERLTGFTELVATAIVNSEAQAEVRRLAEEQAGLRRVATLVARKARPEEVFAAVGDEVTRLLRVQHTSILRYEDDGTATVMSRSRNAELRFGERVALDGDSVAVRVFQTGRPARLDDYEQAGGALGARMHAAGIRSAVGAPIVIEGRTWGAIVASTGQEEPLPADLDSRIAEFTELVATAIANVQAWSDLAASRARIVAAVDDERRSVVRDLHDGAQQRLVHTLITLKLARQALQNGEADAPELVDDAIEHAERANDELRELSHGILPAVLTRGGLAAGVQELGVRTPVPVQIDVSVGRLPAAIEATAYFVVAEALTNVAKHARASSVAVSARIEDGALAVRVRDDGIGGARREGAGLLGLADRLAALDGTLRVEAPARGGTLITAAIPVPPDP